MILEQIMNITVCILACLISITILLFFRGSRWTRKNIRYNAGPFSNWICWVCSKYHCSKYRSQCLVGWYNRKECPSVFRRWSRFIIVHYVHMKNILSQYQHNLFAKICIYLLIFILCKFCQYAKLFMLNIPNIALHYVNWKLHDYTVSSSREINDF